jgi:hypothetical protein
VPFSDVYHCSKYSLRSATQSRSEDLAADWISIGFVAVQRAKIRSAVRAKKTALRFLAVFLPPANFLLLQEHTTSYPINLTTVALQVRFHSAEALKQDVAHVRPHHSCQTSVLEDF